MATIKFECQECDRSISAPDDLAGKRARCPRCKAVVRVPDRRDNEVPSAEEQTTSHVGAEPEPGLNESRFKLATLGLIKWLRERFTSENILRLWSVFRDILFHRIYVTPKMVRLIFYALLHPGLIMIPTVSTVVMVRDGENSGGIVQLIGGSLCCAGSIWLLIGFYPAWILARYFSVPFVRVLRCPNCDFETDAVDVWSAGGYNDYRERHVLLWRNPLDGSRIAHKNCPMCETTILIQERWPLEHWWMP